MEQLVAVLPAVALSLLRPFGLFLMLPLLSSRHLGGILIRNALVLLVALPIVPVNMENAPQFVAGMGVLLCWYGQELLLGLLIGFAAAIPLWALDMASFVIDTMRGASMATVLNPLLGEQSSIFGMFFSQLFAVLFLSFGGWHQLLTVLYGSYSLFPPGQGVPLGSALLLFLQQSWLLMFHLGFSFALPAMMIMILVDIALGLLNRSAQQLNVFFLAMPIKSAFTLLLLIVSLSVALSLYQQRVHAIADLIAPLFDASLHAALKS